MPHFVSPTALSAVSAPIAPLAQAAGAPALVEASASGASGGPQWLTGLVETDFVVVSVVVGLVLTAALVVLVRRLWPSAS